MTVIYGIKNCDTMKKARAFLEAANIEYHFHDYKKDGILSSKMEQFVEALGWQSVINRSGTTFRNLPESDKLDLDASKAIALMLAQPSMIKRPILEKDGAFLVGFKPDQYRQRLLT